ncbi:hypothetical protein ACNKHT_17755 [Shigella flexneri]
MENGSWEFYRRGGGNSSDIHHRIAGRRFTSGKTAPYCAGLSPLERGTPLANRKQAGF